MADPGRKVHHGVWERGPGRMVVDLEVGADDEDDLRRRRVWRIGNCDYHRGAAAGGAPGDGDDVCARW